MFVICDLPGVDKVSLRISFTIKIILCAGKMALIIPNIFQFCWDMMLHISKNLLHSFDDFGLESTRRVL